jgi:uncharacterized protein (TIGR01244 family)
MPGPTPTPINDRISVAGQIGIADIPGIAKAGYRLIVNNRPDGEEPGQPGRDEIAAEAKKHGIAYHYIPVTTSAITLKDVTEFHHAASRGPTPILAHCRSGTRSYLLWALSRALFERESPLMLAAEAQRKGYDLRVLPALAEKLQAEKDKA